MTWKVYLPWADSGRQDPEPLPEPLPESSPGAEMAATINEHRAAHGLIPLEPHVGLMAAAQAHAADMMEQDYFSHDSLDMEWWQRIQLYYPHWNVAEVIAAGYSTSQTAVWGWMDSPPHRELLLGGYQHIGAGVAKGGGKWRSYYVVNFGTPTLGTGRG